MRYILSNYRQNRTRSGRLASWLSTNNGVGAAKAIVRKLIGIRPSLMSVTIFLVLNLPVLAQADQDGWISLFNGKNLDGWHTFLLATGRNNDPKGIFKVENGMIHVLGIPENSAVEREVEGYLATNQEYSDVRIHVEYKWGVRRIPPDDEGKKNSGLFYLVSGPDNNPQSVQCQIEESDTGDLELDGGGLSATTQVVAMPFPLYSEDDYGPSYHLTIGGPLEHRDVRIIKNTDFEDRTGWNTVEAVLEGNQATHIVNGRIVNRVWDIRKRDQKNPSQMVPLTSGHIYLESTGAEIWFRNVKIKPAGRSAKSSAGVPLTTSEVKEHK